MIQRGQKMEYMYPPTGHTLAKIHFYPTFLFSLIELLNANYLHMWVLMSWFLSNIMDWTMIANITTYVFQMFHMDLCALVGWETTPGSRITQIWLWVSTLWLWAPHSVDQPANKFIYAGPSGKPNCGGLEDYYCSSWGCETYQTLVKKYGRN